MGPWDFHGLGLAHSNPTWTPPGQAYCWPIVRSKGPCPLISHPYGHLDYLEPTTIPHGPQGYYGHGPAYSNPMWSPRGIWMGQNGLLHSHLNPLGIHVGFGWATRSPWASPHRSHVGPTWARYLGRLPVSKCHSQYVNQRTTTTESENSPPPYRKL